MQQKVLTEPDELSAPMQELMEARNRAHRSEVDLTTPVPLLDKRPDALPPKLTSYFVLSKDDKLPGLHKLKMTLWPEKGPVFGTLTVNVRINGSMIELDNAAYDSSVRGCSAYAIRHFLAAFKDIKNLSFSTNDIYSQDVARPFAAMGFEIVTRGSHELIDLSAMQKGEPLSYAVAKLDFRKAPIKRLVFKRLGLSAPRKPTLGRRAIRPSAEAHKIS